MGRICNLFHYPVDYPHYVSLNLDSPPLECLPSSTKPFAAIFMCPWGFCFYVKELSGHFSPSSHCHCLSAKPPESWAIACSELSVSLKWLSCTIVHILVCIFVLIEVNRGVQGVSVGRGGCEKGPAEQDFRLRRKFRGKRLRIRCRSWSSMVCHSRTSLPGEIVYFYKLCVFALTICSTLNCPVKYPCWLSCQDL